MLLQIIMIWGAAQAALFSFPAHAGEWESYKDLKQALVRSPARRDVPLPLWVNRLDYTRPYYFWDVTPAERKTEDKSHEKSNPVNSSIVDHK